MEGKYIIILLFIFLVFLMGSINSTITNNFNNTTGSEDHFNLTNLSYANSGHTGFQASDTLNDDVAGLGYVTNISGNFLNLTTGGEVMGKISANVTTAYTGAGYTIYEGGRTSSPFKIRYTLNDLNGAFNIRMNIRDDLTADLKTAESTGWAFGLRPNATVDDFTIARCRFTSTGALNGSCPIIFAVTGENGIGGTGYLTNTTSIARGNFSVYSLSGTGNDYPCLDSTGTFYRDPTGCS